MATITPSLLKLIIADQINEQIIPSDYRKREAETKLVTLAKNKEIIVITGLRRCGKSVLLHTIRNQETQSNYYFNFEDERLATFTHDDFQLLYEIFIELYGVQKKFYFDEIQNIPGWEMFVRRLYNAGNKIFITGSNATLFSEELGTRLTGRYIALRIYPFSFYEYAKPNLPKENIHDALSTKDIGQVKKLFTEYFNFGGIPEYAKHQEAEYLHMLYESILYRDIIARYKISNVAVFKKLVFFLASNCSKEITYAALRKFLGLGSITTVSDYCNHLENSYLCFFLNRYNPSIKIQQQSPKKLYFIDHALARTVGFQFSEDIGRVLENIIFIELKRRNHTIFYHRDKKECDFIIQENHRITEAIQVCHDLTNAETKKREINGLMDALVCYDLKQGLIITETEEWSDSITLENKTYEIRVIPAWKWLLQTYQAHS